MDNTPDNPTRSIRPNCFVVKAIPTPSGLRSKRKSMAQLEAEATRRRWMLISGALVAALAAGILIGRFLLT